jgi:hypothetical protein
MRLGEGERERDVTRVYICIYIMVEEEARMLDMSRSAEDDSYDFTTNCPAYLLGKAVLLSRYLTLRIVLEHSATAPRTEFELRLPLCRAIRRRP